MTDKHECKFVPRLDGYDHCECGKKVQVYDPVQQKHIDHRLETAINAYGSLRERYLKLLEFVTSIANHPNLSETEIDFIKFYVLKEEEASILLDKIGEA